MQFLEVAATIIGILISIGVLIGAVAYAVGQWRGGSSKALRETNGDLLVRVQLLEKNHAENTGKISALETQVSVLTEKKTGYESLITRALERFFENHPDVAQELDKGISSKL